MKTIHPEARIGHVHLKVADLERALRFYRDVLGFEVTQRIGSSAAFLSAGGEGVVVPHILRTHISESRCGARGEHYRTNYLDGGFGFDVLGVLMIDACRAAFLAAFLPGPLAFLDFLMVTSPSHLLRFTWLVHLGGGPSCHGSTHRRLGRCLEKRSIIGDSTSFARRLIAHICPYDFVLVWPFPVGFGGVLTIEPPFTLPTGTALLVTLGSLIRLTSKVYLSVLVPSLELWLPLLLAAGCWLAGLAGILI
jgi:hypothetical protein